MTFTELMERFEKAQKSLIQLKNEKALFSDTEGMESYFSLEEARLNGKLEGISLAISYLREYERVNDRN